MKRRRIRLEHRAVPRGYDPGYPAELSPSEYRELILASTHRRAAHLALAAGLLASGSARAQESAPAPREARILALLRDLHAAHPGSWYRMSSFPNADDARHVIVPSIPISYGNSHNGVFDAGRARKLARELFEIYGLEPRSDQRIEVEGGTALLDGHDAKRRVGFELRGRTPEHNVTFGKALPEPPEEALDDNERAALEHRGLRLHVAEVDAYPVMDGDQFTPTLAYLAGIVSFLNELTDGPDIDLSAILLRDAQRFPLPSVSELHLPPGVEVEQQGESFFELRVERAATLRLAFGGAGAMLALPAPELKFGAASNAKPEPARSTRGFPTVLGLSVVHDGSEHELPLGDVPISMRLLQGKVDARSREPLLFAPSDFDAARPFVLELELAPGEHAFWDRFLLVGLPVR